MVFILLLSGTLHNTYRDPYQQNRDDDFLRWLRPNSGQDLNHRPCNRSDDFLNFWKISSNRKIHWDVQNQLQEGNSENENDNNNNNNNNNNKESFNDRRLKNTDDLCKDLSGSI
ncbi:hypothetical protein Glove_48g66 [Diversispora epigaea]|uniref:Uncharacterized protein n=1 Tax=Diversispora epigaea TaxID=1348612 RepID=A0A397JQB4_9GLOM|nr:hypothetical protein Glove_48g66 [Diversispora epigaea]